MGKENEEYFQHIIQGPDGKLKTTGERWDTSHQSAQAAGSGCILSILAAEKRLGPSWPQPACGMEPGKPTHRPKNRAAT